MGKCVGFIDLYKSDCPAQGTGVGRVESCGEMVKSEPEDSVYKEDIKEEKSAKSPRDLIWECFQKVMAPISSFLLLNIMPKNTATRR